MINIKLMTLGDDAVGKSSILMTYYNNEFPSEPATVVDNYAVMIDQRPYYIYLGDTAGHPDYDRLRPLLYPQTVVNPISFQNIIKWKEEVTRHSIDSEIILIGNKSDLRHDPISLEYLKLKGLSVVPFEDAVQAASDIGAYKYIECSALTQSNIQSIFNESVRLYNSKRTCTKMMHHTSGRGRNRIAPCVIQ